MEIKLKFLGAAQNVTGSRYLLEVSGRRILVDCGLYQERDYKVRNWDPFPVSPETIEVLLLTHAHLDHCGYIPRLVKNGFNGKIICTSATADITKIVLLDSGKIQEEDARFKKKRHKREGRKGPYPVIPLYTQKEAEACFNMFSKVNYNNSVRIGDGIEVTFNDGGHILGSSMVKININHDSKECNIIFSGDVGRWDKPILQDPTVFSDADFVISESTYGNRVHEKTQDIQDALCDIINTTYQSRGNIIIPSFSIERSQEVLYHLNQLLLEERIPPLLTFLDSPMAIRVTDVFVKHPELFDDDMLELIKRRESPFDFPGLKITRSTIQSKAINNIRGTVIVIAGSGMCTGGRVKHHLVNNISKPESTILFVGYQAIGTLGRRIIDGDREVRIHGKHYPVRARIEQLKGFSAHADRDELTKWLSGLQNPPKRVFITHGEPESAFSFAKHLEEKFGWQVSVPAYGDEVVLE